MDSRTTDAFVKAYKEQRDEIADSDLDDEQPVSLQVTLPLGEWRRFLRLQSNREFAKKALGG